MAETDLYVGKEPATFDYEGAPVFIGPGIVVRAGHPMMKGRENLFEPLRVHYELDAPATSPSRTSLEPDEPDDLPTLRAQAADLGVKVDGRWNADRLKQEIAKVGEKGKK